MNSNDLNTRVYRQVEETFAERFWGALGMLPGAERIFNVAGTIKKHFTSSYAQNAIV